MAASIKDINEVVSSLPHPREWRMPKMEAAHTCEDGKWRVFTFKFVCIEIRELEDPIAEFKGILGQELNASR